MKLRNEKTTCETITGYKKAKNNHLIVLEIPSTAQHNMDRTNVKDKQFAKHRCSEAIVKEIINLTTKKSANEAYSIHDKQFKYILGQKVVPDMFDPKLDKVCSGGIHFFLDMKRAEFYERNGLNGEYKEWHDNGQLYIQSFYQNGNLDGEYKEWHDNGQLNIHTLYTNGFREGERKEWYRDGEYKKWYYDGQLNIQTFYKNGKLEGERKV